MTHRTMGMAWAQLLTGLLAYIKAVLGKLRKWKKKEASREKEKWLSKSKKKMNKQLSPVRDVVPVLFIRESVAKAAATV